MKTKKTIEDFSKDEMAEFSQKQLLATQGGARMKSCEAITIGGYSTNDTCGGDVVNDIYRRYWDGNF